MRKMDSLGKIRSSGSFLRLIIAALVVVGLGSPAQAWSGRRTKVYVPVAPAYAIQNGVPAQSPGVIYSYAPVAGAPVGMAPGTGGYNGVYYAPPTGAPAAMAPSFTASSTAYAPQGFYQGTGFAPAGSPFFGNVPPKIGDSRMTDDGRKDVVEDIRDFYRETKTSEKSRTALRKTLKEQAREKYVEVIGGDVQASEDLKDSENREIDQIVDIVMREDASSNAAAPNGNANPYSYQYPHPYPYPNANPYPSGNGFFAPPMYYYYFVYPIAPAAIPHHQHHLFHHQ